MRCIAPPICPIDAGLGHRADRWPDRLGKRDHRFARAGLRDPNDRLAGRDDLPGLRKRFDYRSVGVGQQDGVGRLVLGYPRFGFGGGELRLGCVRRGLRLLVTLPGSPSVAHQAGVSPFIRVHLNERCACTSKEDLAVRASRRALESAFRRWSAAAEENPEDPIGAVIAFYLSTEHRDEKMDGCPVVALGSDAARQSSDVKASFETGIREYLKMFSRWLGELDGDEPSSRAMAILSTMVGAVVLSRAVNDERLSKQLLQAAAKGVLMGVSAGNVQHASSDESIVEAKC